MAKIRIDQRTYEISDGKNLLEACLELGLNLPYFCWHPAMGSVGACRQCAVKQFKNEQDKHGKLVMACITPARDGTILSVEDADARAFRKSVIEWLMLNHPHDCPICDEGGECHLQDMTVMTGHTYRRTRFKKRTFKNQDLGPFVNHEMNRCIACYRCVRFYREYAGGRDFDAFAAHDHVYFGRHEDGTLESEFSGNLVEVCPTGVFTDKTLKKHYTRKWDLQTAPSVCAHCGVGCNTIPGERYGSLRRVRNRYHPEINGYFLCDLGRYGYEFVNGERRIRTAWMKSGTPARAAEEFLGLIQDRERLARTAGIGSPRASLESGFALKDCVGAENYFSGLSKAESRLIERIVQVMKSTPAKIPSLRDIESSDAIFVLGENVADTAPRMALAIRQAIKTVPMRKTRQMKIPDWLDGPIRETIQEEKSPVFVATPRSTRLSDIAAEEIFGAPNDLARLGFAVASLIDPDAPKVDGLTEAQRSTAARIAKALREAEHPTVISGTGALSKQVIEAAANIAGALSKAGRAPALSYVVPECNSLGAGLLGGRSLEEAFEAARSGKIDTAIILENDLFRRAPAPKVEEFLRSLKQVIVMDSIATAMVPRASLLLPVATFAESSGTYVNHEARAQRFFRVLAPEAEIRESWRWIRGAATLDEVIGALAGAAGSIVDKSLSHVAQAAPPENYRKDGQRIPRQPHRYSGRTAMFANQSVFDPQPPEDRDSALSFSMEGSELQPPAALIPRFWSPGWNSIQALNRFQSEIPGPLRGGSAGVRLIEPTASFKYFTDVPKAFERAKETFLAVPVQHVFGSDETSALSPAVRERIPRPYVAFSPPDAERLASEAGIREGDEIRLSLFPDLKGASMRIDRSLPPGVIGVPTGIPGMPFVFTEGAARCEVLRQEARGAA